MGSYTFAGLLIILAFTARHASSKQLCDIRIWYLNLVTDEVFNIEFNSAQLQLKNSIETLVLNSAEMRKTDCHILQMYNDMLEETFNYKPSDAGMAMVDQSMGKGTDTKSKDDAETKSENSKDNENKPEQEVAAVDVNSEKGNDNTEEIINKNKEIERDKLSRVQNENSENSNKKPEEPEGSKESDSKIPIESGDNKESGGVDIENIDIPQEIAKDDEANEASEEIDETELFEDESDIEEDLDDSEGDSLAKPITNETNTVNQTNSANQTKDIKDIKKVSHSISFGISRLKVCYLYDVFDVFHCEKNSTNRNTNTHRQQLSNNVCPLGNFCTDKCYYVYSISFCTIGYSNRTAVSNTNIRAKDVNEGSHKESKDTNSNNMSENVIEDKDSQDDGDALNKDKITQDVSSEDTERTQTGVEKETLPLNGEETGHKEGTLQQEPNTKASSGLSTDNEQRNMDEQITALEKEELKLRSDLQEPKHSEPDVTNLQDVVNRSKRPQTVTVATHKDEVADKDQTLSFKEFEEIINRKTSEYGPKIQTLEIMIMKLENQLLTEKLNKQNHSSTITKLENLILKLENDLLKINKNYQNLKFETENVSKKQNAYLELANKQQEQMSKRLELPDHSTKSFELVSQHQSRINELSDMLKNQSALINKMKQRYDTLEDQNLRLHQMIMNQTIFMTSIIQTVQDLSEQNAKNKLEMNEMKRTISETLNANSQKEKQLSSLDRDIVSKLESLVFGSDSSHKTKREVSLKDTDSSREETSKENIFRWCSASSRMSATCVDHSFIKSICIPFKRFIWSSCNTTNFDRSNSHGEMKVSELPDVPDVLDQRTEEKHDDENILSRKNLPSTMDIDENEMGERKNTLDETNNKDPKEIKTPISENIDDSIMNDKNNQDDTPTPSKTKEMESTGESQEFKSIAEKDDPENKADKADIVKDLERVDHSPGERNEQLAVSKDDEENKKDEELNNGEENVVDKKENVVVEKSDQKLETIQSKESSNVESDKQADSRGVDTKEAIQENDAINNTKSDTVEKEKVDAQTTKSANSEKKADEASKISQERSSGSAQKQSEDVKETKTGEKPKPQPKKGKESQVNKKPLQRKVPINLQENKGSDVKDCYDHYRRGMKRDGLFKVKPVGAENALEVFCDMRNGGWTVIQRRQDGSTNFFQEWNNYKKGFGGLYGEHWLGNDNIHTITNQDYYQLRVDLMDWDKKKKFAIFDYFLVDNENDGYRLHIDGYSGDAGDGLTKHNGHKFSTKDVDNDKVVKEFGGSCAKRFHGAGWYYKCYASNLNGKYYRGGKIPEKQFDGVTWKPWTGPNYSIKKVEMKIRPASAVNK